MESASSNVGNLIGEREYRLTESWSGKLILQARVFGHIQENRFSYLGWSDWRDAKARDLPGVAGTPIKHIQVRV